MHQGPAVSRPEETAMRDSMSRAALATALCPALEKAGRTQIETALRRPRTLTAKQGTSSVAIGRVVVMPSIEDKGNRWLRHGLRMNTPLPSAVNVQRHPRHTPHTNGPSQTANQSGVNSSRPPMCATTRTPTIDTTFASNSVMARQVRRDDRGMPSPCMATFCHLAGRMTTRRCPKCPRHARRDLEELDGVRRWR